MENEFPPEEDSDLERIRARIRRERFDLFDAWARWRWWYVLAGAVIGLALGIWSIVAGYDRLINMGPNGPSLATQQVVGFTFVGGLAGLGIPAVLHGLFLFLRPVIAAIRLSPEEFERQYPDSRK
jgi:hypothetical protein